MSTVLPSIPQAVALAYRDLKSAARELAPLALIAFAVMVATSVAESALLSPGSDSTSADILLIFIIGLVQTFLLTPYFIAVHRFVILGEVAARYALTPRDLRVQSYFLSWAAFSAATLVPVFLWVVSPWTAGDPLQTNMLIVPVMVMAYIVVIMTVGLRLAVLFPAIAVDAPAATFADAMADTKGHTWRIFLIGLLALMPLWLVDVMVVGMLGRLDVGVLLSTLVQSVAGSAVSVVMATLLVVVTSRLYEWLGARVKGVHLSPGQ
jgi:hypothetical protein